MHRPLVVVLAVLAAVLAGAAPAPAAEPRPFGKLDCVAQSGDGVRFCQGSPATAVPSFDGIPLDVNVTLPPAGAGDGPHPLVLLFHGYGGRKRGLDDPPGYEGSRRMARRGFTVLSFTARGFNGSCGSPEVRLAAGVACARGWVHLDDVRFETRDAQYLAGLLVDEGLAHPTRIGAWADSYGGQPSVALAILRDRVMLGALPGERDGAFAEWRSPRGTPMRLAAAAPFQTWGDLAYSLLPNGRYLDYARGPADLGWRPYGIEKATFVAGFFATGQVDAAVPPRPKGYYSPPGVDPDSDLTTWYARIQRGEPYAADPGLGDIVDELAAHHSPLHLRMDREPAPLLLSSGWADDLFPVDESLRLRNEIVARFPRATVGMFFSDFGHQRGANERAVVEERNDRILDWLDFHVRGVGERPFAGVQARTIDCGEGRPGEGPYRAPTWEALHPGEVRARAEGTQNVQSAGGDPRVARVIDPILAGNNPCGTVAGATEPGTAEVLGPVAEGRGYTLLGSPTVLASLRVTGPPPEDAQLATRLWDVAPDGTQTLVTRGLLRPRGEGREVFQLHPGGWRFAAGHRPRLELLGRDAPYARPSNAPFSIAVSDLELRLPVRERPAGGGRPPSPVRPPAPRVVPPGQTPVDDPAAPPVAGAGGRPRVSVAVRRGRGGCARGALLVRVARNAASARSLEVRVRGRRVGLDARAPYRVRVGLRRLGRRGARARVTAVVRRDGARSVRVRRTVRRCG